MNSYKSLLTDSLNLFKNLLDGKTEYRILNLYGLEVVKDAVCEIEKYCKENGLPINSLDLREIALKSNDIENVFLKMMEQIAIQMNDIAVDKDLFANYIQYDIKSGIKEANEYIRDYLVKNSFSYSIKSEDELITDFDVSDEIRHKVGGMWVGKFMDSAGKSFISKLSELVMKENHSKIVFIISTSDFVENKIHKRMGQRLLSKLIQIDKVVILVAHYSLTQPSWIHYLGNLVLSKKLEITHTEDSKIISLEKVKNPYIAGKPLKKDCKHVFFGRDDVFKFIQNNLSGSEKNNIIVLHGERRTGKTSILYQLSDYLDEKYIPVFIDAQSLVVSDSSNIGSLLYQIANKICHELKCLDILIELPSEEEFRKSPTVAFEQKLLANVKENIGKDRYILLLFDEFEELEKKRKEDKLDESFLGYLRSLMQHHDELSFIFAGTQKLEEMGSKYWSILFNIAKYKKVSFLSAEDAKRLITEPIKNLPIKITDSAISLIMKLTANHPYFIQLICSELFNYSKDIQRKNYPLNEENATVIIDTKEVDYVMDRVLDESTAHIDFIWRYCTDTERLVIVLMNLEISDAESAVALKDMIDKYGEQMTDDFKDGIDKLIKKDIIEDVGLKRYRFKVDFVRRAVNKSKKYDDISKDLREKIYKKASNIEISDEKDKDEKNEHIEKEIPVVRVPGRVYLQQSNGELEEIIPERFIGKNAKTTDKTGSKEDEIGKVWFGRHEWKAVCKEEKPFAKDVTVKIQDIKNEMLVVVKDPYKTYIETGNGELVEIEDIKSYFGNLCKVTDEISLEKAGKITLDNNNVEVKAITYSANKILPGASIIVGGIDKDRFVVVEANTLVGKTVKVVDNLFKGGMPGRVKLDDLIFKAVNLKEPQIRQSTNAFIINVRENGILEVATQKPKK